MSGFNVTQFSGDVLSRVMDATKAFNALPLGDEFDDRVFEQPAFKEALGALGTRLVQLSESVASKRRRGRDGESRQFLLPCCVMLRRRFTLHGV